MQEPERLNLLNVLQKSLKFAQKKTYLHRLIYIGSYIPNNARQDSRYLQLLFESNIKLINDDYCEEPVTGFGLVYSGYFINIIEGPEETVHKHVKTIMEGFKQNLNFKVEKVKMLLCSHHIIKRYFVNYMIKPAKPPILLERIEASNSAEENERHIHNCVMKLYRLSEYLRNQQMGLLRAAVDNISELCQRYLPEDVLLDFLLSSPALVDLEFYVNVYASVPEVKSYQETVWPAPPDFVPYNVIGEDRTKRLMYTPEEIVEKKENEDSKLEL